MTSYTISITIAALLLHLVKIASGIFPFQLNKPEGLYYGWVRLSLIQEGTGAGNYNTHMYIHEAGLAENPDVPVTVEVVDSDASYFHPIARHWRQSYGADLQFSIQAATYDEQVKQIPCFYTSGLITFYSYH